MATCGGADGRGRHEAGAIRPGLQRAVEVAGRHAKVPQAPSWGHHARRHRRGAGPGRGAGLPCHLPAEPGSAPRGPGHGWGAPRGAPRRRVVGPGCYPCWPQRAGHARPSSPLHRGTFPREWQRDRALVLVQRAAWQSPCHATELTGKAWWFVFFLSLRLLVVLCFQHCAFVPSPPHLPHNRPTVRQHSRLWPPSPSPCKKHETRRKLLCYIRGEVGRRPVPMRFWPFSPVSLQGCSISLAPTQTTGFCCQPAVLWWPRCVVALAWATGLPPNAEGLLGWEWARAAGSWPGGGFRSMQRPGGLVAVPRLRVGMPPWKDVGPIQRCPSNSSSGDSPPCRDAVPALRLAVSATCPLPKLVLCPSPPDDCCADLAPPSHSTFKPPPFGIAPPSPHPDTIAHSPSH